MHSRFCVPVFTVFFALSLHTHALCATKPAPKPVSAAPIVVVEPKPIPTGPNVRTQKEFNQQYKAFLNRTILDAYKKSGSHDSKWDSAVETFLNGYILLSAEDSDAPMIDKLIEQGKAIVGLGCNDPLVLSCYGICLFSNSKQVEARPFLEKSLTSLKKSNYPSCRAAVIPSYLDIAVKNDKTDAAKDGAGRYRQEAIELYVEAFHDGSFGTNDQRVALKVYSNVVGKLTTTTEDMEFAYRYMKNDGKVDPYVLKVIAGRNYIAEAWLERGSGWGTSVSEEGWKGFDRCLNLARPQLVSAWKAHPEFPEAPESMITLAMADHADPGETCRLWFDRSVAAQMDYYPAYSSLIWSLYPRWGGSSEEMYSFGEECLETKRFDTWVPWLFFTTLADINNDQGGDKNYLKTTKTADLLNEMFQGYQKSDTYHWTSDDFQTLMAGTKWYCGDYAGARKLFDRLDNPNKSLFLATFGTTFPNAITSIYGSQPYGNSKKSSPNP